MILRFFSASSSGASCLKAGAVLLGLSLAIGIGQAGQPAPDDRVPVLEALPDTAETTMRDFAQHAPAQAGVAQDTASDFALPALPDVVVVLGPPRAAAPLLDEAVLRAALEPLRARFRLKPALMDGFAAAYAGQGWQALWIDGAGALSPKAEALRLTLARADEDGLDAARLLSAIGPLPHGLVPEEKRATLDAALSFAAYLYAQDARGGRIDPSSLSNLITPHLSLPSPEEVLERVIPASAAELPARLNAYQPQHAGYQALKAALLQMQAEQNNRLHESASPEITSAITPGEAAGLPAGFMGETPLYPGMEDARVPLLRQRLNLPPAGGQVYDLALVEAVKAFQRAQGIKANGRITARTRAALEAGALPAKASEPQITRSRPPGDKTATLIANMERWRWLPSDLGQTHIFVNVPDFDLKLMDDGAKVFETRVIVGRPETQTPIFSDAMDFLIVNPSWHVPPSIMKKEFLPRLAEDPDYAAKRGFEVVRRGNAVSVRQPPGERNALGFIKFMFPNQHAVYLHDTPSRGLFSASHRAFSHGCVRVEGPFQLAEQILLKKQGFSEKALRAMVGRGERTIKLTDKIPVHLTYFTLFVDETGALVSRDDLYGHDARVKRALAL